MLSTTIAISTKTSPRISICTGTCPSEVSTNCGRIAAKNTAAFGFVNPTTKPSRRIRRPLFGAGGFPSASASDRRFWNVRTPSQTR